MKGRVEGTLQRRCSKIKFNADLSAEFGFEVGIGLMRKHKALQPRTTQKYEVYSSVEYFLVD